MTGSGGADLTEVQVICPRVFEDDRGYVFERYSRRVHEDLGIDCEFVQINQTYSRAGVLRGLHYQLRSAQAKLVSVTRGRIFDVAVDVRRGSPTFGRWTGALLSAEQHEQLFIPVGFAHGFCALEESEVLYLLSSFYDPAGERGLAHDDPRIGIDWPLARPLLSPRDRALPRLAELAAEELPRYGG